MDFDFYDADQMEVFEEAFEKASIEINKALAKKDKQSVMIREVCGATINMLDDIFGEGTANEVFGGETNFKQCIAVFTELVKERSKQDEELNIEINAMAGIVKEKEIEQQPNRATRRATRKN